MDKAIEELRKTSGVKASKKSGRSAADGLIAIKNIDDQIFMIEVNSKLILLREMTLLLNLLPRHSNPIQKTQTKLSKN